MPEAFIIGEKFINKQSVALILGDNFFYGQGFTKRLKQQIRAKSGSTIFTYKVNNPQDYGIVEIKKNKMLNLTINAIFLLAAIYQLRTNMLTKLEGN